MPNLTDLVFEIFLDQGYNLVKRKLKYAVEKGGILCLATHHYDIHENTKTKKTLNAVIDYLDQSNATFIKMDK